MVRRTCLLVLPAIVTFSTHAPAQAPSAELLRAQRPGFEAYAPRPDELARAVEAGEHAAGEYRRYFGASPARFAVVLFDDEAQRLAYGAGRFGGETGLLQWPARTRHTGGVMPWAEVGVIFAEEPGGGVRVHGHFAGGPPAGMDLRIGDRITAVNGAPVASVRAVSAALAALPAGAEVALGVERAGSAVRVRVTKPERGAGWVAREAMMEAFRNAPLVPSARSTIAHEIGHTLLRPHGTPPVWFHEGFASLMDDPGRRVELRAVVRDAGERRIPLATLLTMAHPAASGTRIVERGTAPEAPRRPGEQTVVVRDERGPSGALFYGQSMSLLEFLVDRRGERFIGELAGRLGAGQPLQTALGIDDLGSLEREWLAWLEAGPNPPRPGTGD